MDETSFAQAIEAEGGDALAAPLIRAKLMVLIDEPGFTPHPGDSLLRVFGLAEEDKDEDLILAILEELGLRPPDQATVMAFGEIDTPLRVAEFVALARAGQ